MKILIRKIDNNGVIRSLIPSPLDWPKPILHQSCHWTLTFKILFRCEMLYRKTRWTIFTALHELRVPRLVTIKLSVCPSLCQTRGLWQNERMFCPDIYTTWKNIYPSFADKKNVWWGQRLLPDILGQADPVGAKTPTWIDIRS